MSTTDWLQFDDPRFEVRFRYPTVTPRGEPVEATESQPGDALRVHMRSANRDVYFELTRYPPMSGEEEYRQHRHYLEERFGEGSVTDLTETRMDSLPAQSYTFAWPEGDRIVLLVRTATATYRVIYNPRGPLSAEILATLEMREAR